MTENEDRQVAALEAQVAQLTTAQERSLAAEEGLLKQVWALTADNARLRQPCTHMSHEVGCAWCAMRDHLANAVAAHTHWAGFASAWATAVQAVREAQG